MKVEIRCELTSEEALKLLKSNWEVMSALTQCGEKKDGTTFPPPPRPQRKKEDGVEDIEKDEPQGWEVDW